MSTVAIYFSVENTTCKLKAKAEAAHWVGGILSICGTPSCMDKVVRNKRVKFLFWLNHLFKALPAVEHISLLLALSDFVQRKIWSRSGDQVCTVALACHPTVISTFGELISFSCTGSCCSSGSLSFAVPFYYDWYCSPVLLVLHGCLTANSAATRKENRGNIKKKLLYLLIVLT